jgi:carbon storage regulator CsrA
MGLVITRREDEAVLIGDVIVRVARIQGGTVRLHITAPSNVAIIREELVNVEPRTKRTEKVSGQDQQQGKQVAGLGRVSGAFGFPPGVGDVINAAEHDDGFGKLANFDDGEFCDE